MNEKSLRVNAAANHLSPTLMADASDQELLDFYLSMPPEKRVERFADTARVATITGLGQRTIQFWIEIGVIRAVLIGRKYHVCLHSLTHYLKSRMAD